jgi:hypothetical protein
MGTTTKKSSVIIETRYPRQDATTTEKITVKTYPDNIPLASVSVEGSITKNLGNYESLRVQASVTLPCAVPEIDRAYAEAWRLVETELTNKVNQVNNSKD